MDKHVCEFGSEYDWASNSAFWLPAGTHGSAFSVAQKYRSGRDALKAVAKACKGSHSRVLLPALCCESMVDPFVVHGITPVFYRLNEDYTADTEDVIRKLTADSILLYVPYFGIAPFEKKTLQKIRLEFDQVLFLEDRTQDIFNLRPDRFVPDVTIVSIRKWMAIPDGGILWSNGMRFENGHREETFAKLRTEAMHNKSVYLSTGEPERKKIFRQMLGEASELLDASAEPVAMTEESARLLDRLDLEKIFHHRQENVRALETALMPALHNGKLQAVTDKPERSTLYYPVITDEQSRLQGQLAERGIYCPVIWPLPEAAKGVCPVADYTASHMLAIPCDHRYTPEEMAYIGSEIVRVCNEL